MRNLSKNLTLFLLFTFIFMGVLGVSFIPLPAQAGFFSSVLGNDASASTDATDGSQTDQNSQSTALSLQANVSSVSIFQDKQDKKSKDSNKNDKTKENISKNENLNGNMNIASNSALSPATSPLGVSDGTDTSDSSNDEVSVYVVRKGDSISAIADMFDVSVNTILAANDMKKGDKLNEGDVLIILPISGIEHTVAKGQTLKSIAKLYKVDVSDITVYNGIAEDAKLAIGDKIIIPGGEMYDEGGDKPAANLGTAVTRDKNYYITNPIQSLFGYFVNPVPTGRKTQGLHGPGHRGIDIGAPKGTPIYASAGGTVLVVKTGCVVGRRSCGGGYGNMAIVEHPNGAKTLYAHMSKLSTRTGSEVAQGEIIGYVGSTGRSTGPHIHFEVFNAKNPGTDWSWKN